MYKIVSTKDHPGPRFEAKVIELLHQGWQLHGAPFRQDQYSNMAQAMKRLKR